MKTHTHEGFNASGKGLEAWAPHAFPPAHKEQHSSPTEDAVLMVPSWK
jgi:hypothetical protein